MGSVGIDETDRTAQKFDWRAAVKAKQQHLASSTPKQWHLNKEFRDSIGYDPSKGSNLIALDIPRRSGLFSDREIQLTESYTAQALIEELRSGGVSSLELTTAFCKRAAIAQQLSSCLTEVFYSEALKRAKELDNYLEQNGKVIGPLHGLPISVKDSFRISGQQSTVGYASFLQDPVSDHNSPLIQMLLDMGAVLYVKTNIPQTMMTGDSENNIFGRTLNPHNTSLTAGGSSGGEGALVGFRGSVLGVGTDIAGSIRIPALCCGVYGFKPTADRVPFGDQVSGAMEGLPGLIAAAGPLAHSLGDIELFLKTVLSASTEDYDSTALSVPWRNVHLPERLRIGLLPEAKSFPLHPPVRRALKQAAAALSAAGHEIIHLSDSGACDIALGNRIAFAYYTTPPDLSEQHFGPDGEPMVASVAARSHPMFTGELPVPFDLPPFEKIEALYNVRHSYSEAWREQWVTHKLDVVLCPAAQNTAVPHDTFGWPPYTQIWNVLDYPACVIPYSKASRELDPEADENDEYGPQPQYVAEDVDGVPCSVQVVTRRMKDEECLEAAKIIDKVLREFVPAK